MSNYDKETFKAVCASADYNRVIAYLKGLDDGQEMLEKYKNIFENGAYAIKSDDGSISDILRAYEDYLKWVLIKRPPTLIALLRFILKCGRASRHLKKKGYYVNAGFTAPYFDIYIWRKQNDEIVSVEMPDGSVDVPLIAMDEKISGGWLDYLSLGEAGTGAWATKKGIYYFKKNLANCS